jgi:hypothetical protein
MQEEADVGIGLLAGGGDQRAGKSERNFEERKRDQERHGTGEACEFTVLKGGEQQARFDEKRARRLRVAPQSMGMLTAPAITTHFRLN